MPINYSGTRKRWRFSVNGLITGHYCCNTCGKRFKYPTHFSTHKKWECQKEPRFRCPHCPYRSHVKNNVKKHIGNVHAAAYISNLLPFEATFPQPNANL
ncbi:hypothetical protein GE061_003428 [Apolygus lucorum]|uniref:Uncharacterized protein n=1 Tax=Apolygus lucorum TaxID=248454 RepID=A0A6A4JK97_APOLU|nr:hypothetical protein GE061_003428 [Apolygus lucorum]